MPSIPVVPKENSVVPTREEIVVVELRPTETVPCCSWVIVSVPNSIPATSATT